MTIKPAPKKGSAIHFPTSREHGAFPFPTSKSVDQSGSDQPEEPNAEELRLMADTMPGDGPGD